MAGSTPCGAISPPCYTLDAIGEAQALLFALRCFHGRGLRSRGLRGRGLRGWGLGGWGLGGWGIVGRGLRGWGHIGLILGLGLGPLGGGGGGGSLLLFLLRTLLLARLNRLVELILSVCDRINLVLVVGRGRKRGEITRRRRRKESASGV